MSCKDWNVNDRCKAITDFAIFGLDVQTGDIGTVEAIHDQGPAHSMSISWDRLGKTLDIAEIHYRLIEKYREPQQFASAPLPGSNGGPYGAAQ